METDGHDAVNGSSFATIRCDHVRKETIFAYPLTTTAPNLNFGLMLMELKKTFTDILLLIA
jgi:hypothetical protein